MHTPASASSALKCSGSAGMSLRNTAAKDQISTESTKLRGSLERGRAWVFRPAPACLPLNCVLLGAYQQGVLLIVRLNLLAREGLAGILCSLGLNARDESLLCVPLSR